MVEDISGIIGKKLGMTRIYGDDRKVQSLTAVEAGPCTVTQVKTEEKEGYNAVQLGFETTKRLKSPLRGHLKDLGMFRYLRELRVEKAEGINRGDTVDASIFSPGDKVDVTGVTKGKGFAGVVKRYHFAGGFKTHGQSDRHRAPGSIGASASPGRVLKGTRMAGHMGNEQLTVRNLEILSVDTERNIVFIKGAIPGGRNQLLIIRKSVGRK